MPSSRCWNLVVALGHLAEGTVICSQVPLRIPPSTSSQGPAGTGLPRLAAVPGVVSRTAIMVRSEQAKSLCQALKGR